MNWKKELKEWAQVVALAVALGVVLTQFVIVSAVVPSGSMQNTINPGDRLIALRFAYWFEGPQRGQIAVFRNPDDERVLFVKRVIGLPGETVEVKGGVVYIDGRPLDEPYIREAPVLDCGPFEVPEGCYFMMGDNRNHSHDSRFWQNTYVKREKILGRALFSYWPQPAWLW